MTPQAPSFLKKVTPGGRTEDISFIGSVEKSQNVGFAETNVEQWLRRQLNSEVTDLKIAHARHLSKHKGAQTDYIGAIDLANEGQIGAITNVFQE